MKKNGIYENEEQRQAMRQVLIQKMDTALDAKEPDMDTIDLCRALLDALEHGSCQPSGRRMQRELARLAEEIDYIPKANAMVVLKPMTVRRALVGVLAACVCLLLIPMSIMLLRGGSHGTAGESLTTEDDTVTTEAVEVFDGVTFLRGDRIAQYDSLAACLDQEMPELYYPSVFPDDMKPTSVTVTEKDDGAYTEICFHDPRYSMFIRPWNLSWEDEAWENGCQDIVMNDIMGSDAYCTLRAFRKSDDDGFYLTVHTDPNEPNVYEFRTADEESAYSLLVSMHRADTDHIHAWNYKIVEVLQDGDTVRKVYRSCGLCPSE